MTASTLIVRHKAHSRACSPRAALHICTIDTVVLRSHDALESRDIAPSVLGRPASGGFNGLGPTALPLLTQRKLSVKRKAVRTMCKRPDARKKRRARTSLGPFEARVMEILWRSPECTVRDVKRKLARKRAYTTVMTTMSRLYEKGLLQRRKLGNQFVYRTQVSAEDWGRMAASEFVENFAAVPSVTQELVISSLLHALDTVDPRLSDEMQAQVIGGRAARAVAVGTARKAETHSRSAADKCKR